MRTLLRLEEMSMFILFTAIYFVHFQWSWQFYLIMFFVPDISFLAYLINSKSGAAVYNIFHHKGLWILVFILGMYLQNDLFMKIALIFLVHSCFDRIFGYGLKYNDSFDHTHLGWIGKSAKKNNKSF